MVNFKTEIAKSISKITNIQTEELESYIEVPKDTNNGDYSFPCFKLAKSLKKAPQMIAEDIKNQINIDDKFVTDINVINGYLNFFINKSTF